jgi:hypothetical protein
MNAECVILYTNQLTAILCIHVPIRDIACPEMYKRKL